MPRPDVAWPKGRFANRRYLYRPDGGVMQGLEATRDGGERAKHLAIVEEHEALCSI